MYLRAVALGAEPTNALRIAAAKAALPYEAPKRRLPVETPAPRALRAQQQRAEDAHETDEWQTKAAAVRRRLAAVKKGKQP